MFGFSSGDEPPAPGEAVVAVRRGRDASASHSSTGLREEVVERGADARVLDPGRGEEELHAVSSVGVELADRRAAAEREREVDLGEELAAHRFDAGRAADREAVRVEPPEENGVGAERHRLDDVGAAADPAVDEEREVGPDRVADLDERVERRDRAVDLPAAVVRDDDPVDAALARELRVVAAQHALDEQRQRRLLAHPREVVPREPEVRERREHHRRGREHVLLGRRRRASRGRRGR